MSDPGQDPPRIGPKSLAQERRVMAPVDHHDDHDEPVDERWLVSYADMMTLLFGLFVLLFSMSTLDPGVATQIQASTQNSFKADAAPEPPAAVDGAALQRRIENLQSRMRDLQAQLNQRTAELAGMTAAHRAEAVEFERLRGDLALKDARLRELERKTVSPRNKEAERKAASVNPLQTENHRLKSDLDKLKQDLAKEKVKAEQLKKSVESTGGGKGQDFMAVFINWPTKDHDVDLTIQDPSGRIFDFKRREYKGRPGLFALDTRRGPGVELWQSKDIVPGRYKATYQLYNDYGNSEAAPVSAVILTPKGSFELPVVKLSTSGTRRVSSEFEVDKAGGVRILKGR